MKTYSELITLESFVERLEYLRLYKENPSNKERDLLNKFYKSRSWNEIRKNVIRRDLGCDLGVPNLFINDGHILVHHIVPITFDDLVNESPLLLDPNNLITVSYDTHNKIHYRTEVDDKTVIERKPGDTKLW